MPIAKIVTGDDTQIPIQLYKVTRGVKHTFLINGSAIVKASIVSKQSRVIIIPPVLVVDNTLGDDWFDSILLIKFSESETASIKDSQLGEALLEIQVDDGGKTTWHIPIEIEKGTIDSPGAGNPILPITPEYEIMSSTGTGRITSTNLLLTNATGGLTYSDSGVIRNSLDNTKELTISVSSISSGSIRTLTMADFDIDLGASFDITGAANNSLLLGGYNAAYFAPQSDTYTKAEVDSKDAAIVVNAVPLATATLDGLLSKDDFTKLQNTEILTVGEKAEIAINTLKVSNIAHPLVETAVPVGAVFTDTIYDDTAIQASIALKAPQSDTYTKAEVDASIANIPLASANLDGLLSSTNFIKLSNQSGTNTGDQDISGIATNASAIATKQDTLVSGTNLKTINGETLLGSADIVISGEQSSGAQYEIQYSDGAGGFDSNSLLFTDANGLLTANAGVHVLTNVSGGDAFNIQWGIWRIGLLGSTNSAPYLKFVSTGTIGWASDALTANNSDTGLKRLSVGILQATDGTTTGYGGISSDSTGSLVDNVDNTKALQWDVSQISTANTRTITAPDFDFDFNSYFDSAGKLTVKTGGSSVASITSSDLLSVISNRINLGTSSGNWGLFMTSTGYSFYGAQSKQIKLANGNSAPDVGFKHLSSGVIQVTNAATGQGSLIYKNPTKTVTGSNTLLNTDRTVIVNDGSATTQTMPTAVGIAGVRMTIKNVGAGTVTLASDGSETFDVSTSLTINQYECYIVESDGTNWIIVSKF